VVLEQRGVAEQHPVAVLELERPAGGHRLLRLVHEHAVGAGVPDPERATAILDLAVMTGDDTTWIRQHPVVVGRAADGAAVHAEHARALLAELAVLVADDAELDGHGCGLLVI
jgi:hypothetical protein